MYDEFPWIKFGILCVVFIAMIWFMGPMATVKWKLIFSASVPFGVGIALTGRTIKLHR